MKDQFHSGDNLDLLDRLLGMAPLSQPDPWFAARTVARCRSGRDVDSMSLRWSAFFPRWALSATAVLFLGGLALQQAHRIHTLQTHRQHRVQEAFEVMASMHDDSDLSPQDSSL